ncbi:MAG: MASE1 domain-containing protein [Candidatus Sericytochromatia bacterium]|nr:MASE1 domain-containing protein [Candidatus Tanganyikabacteria bacterium]
MRLQGAGLHELARWVVLAGVYVAASRVGLSIATLHENVTAVWPPSGIALAAVLVLGPGIWPGIWLGALLANLATSVSPWAALLISLGNTLEAVGGALLLRMLVPDGRFLGGVRETFSFILACCLAAPAVAATIGVAALGLAEEGLSLSRSALWITWWVGDALGILTLAPVLAFRPDAPPVLADVRRRAAEAAGIAVLTAVACGLAFGPWLEAGDPLRRAYLVLPGLVWAALRFSILGAAYGTALTATLAIWGTVSGFGVFAHSVRNESLLSVQLFVGVVAIMQLVLGATAGERRRWEAETRLLAADLERQVRNRTHALEDALAAASRAETKFRGLVESAPDGVILVDARGTILLANLQMEPLFGYRPDELVGRGVETLVPDRFRERHAMIREAYLQSPRSRTTSSMAPDRPDLIGCRKDGSEVPLEITLSPVVAPDGSTLTIAAIRDVSAAKRREELLRESIEEKNTLLREIHHRVKNNLQIASSLLQLQAEGAGIPAELARILVDSQNRLRAMALVHESLYRSRNLARIDMHDFIDSLGRMVALSTTDYREPPIALRIEAEHAWLPADIATPLGLVINEALANGYAHAFPPPATGTIVVEFAARGDRWILTIRDDGRGLPPDLDIANTRTLGLRLIQALGRQVGAAVSIRSDRGTLVEISLPCVAARPA